MKLLLVTVLSTMLFSSSASAQDGQKIDQLGQFIMKSMKSFDTTNIQSLRKALITESEIQDFIAALDVSEEKRTEIRERLNGGFFNEQVERMFNRLVRESREIGIIWENIEYEDFLYKLKIRDGLKELKGDIYFRDGDSYYEMRVHSALLNGKFVILELEDLDVSFELHGYPEGYDPYEDLMIEEYEEYEGEEISEESLTPEEEAFIRELEEELERAMAEMEEAEPIDEGEFEEVPEVVIIEAEPVQAPPIEEEIYDFPDVEPEFPGGAVAMKKFISENFNYPEEALEESIQGKVYISFIVEKDGRLTNVKIERSVHPSLDEEARRLIYAMPRWNPGEAKGKKVRTRALLPIIFELSGK